MRCSIASHGGVDVLDGHRVGGGAQRAGDGGLVAGAHGEQRGHRPEQAGDRVGGGEQRAGAVLAVQAELERLLAGGQTGALALGALRLLTGLGEPLLDVAERGGRALVLGVEPLLARVEPGDPGLQGGEVALGALSARATASSRARGQPADLLVGGGRAALAGR